MATDDSDDGSLLRTVTPLAQGSANQQMDVIGWLLFILMAVVLLPLLPVFVVIWLVSKVIGR